MDQMKLLLVMTDQLNLIKLGIKSFIMMIYFPTYLNKIHSHTQF